MYELIIIEAINVIVVVVVIVIVLFCHVRVIDGSYFTSLIECMKMQCAHYEEWMDVMNDYSTVFDDGKNSSAQSSTDLIYSGGPQSLHYRVKSPRPEVVNIITDVFRQSYASKWEELPSGLGLGVSWNFLWTWSKPRLSISQLLIWQKVNHFQDSKELTRKDLLKKNLQRFTDMGGKYGDYFEIMPQTFLLPHEFVGFVKVFTELEAQKSLNNDHNIWIMKPIGLSRGRGISLVRDVSTLTYSQSSVVQRYVERPLCLEGFKFDLRLYILVTSFQPLEAFIYKDGFARLSTVPYSTRPEDINNKFIHLTNSSIQKYNTEEMSKENPLSEENNDVGGSKIALLGDCGLWARLKKGGINSEKVWTEISTLVVKSLVAINEKVSYQPCCFEIFGYDVIIDSNLRPWLLEVNASPSLARENNLDIRVKNAMIRDTIALIDPIPFDRNALSRILKRRLQEINKLAKPSLNLRSDPNLEKDLNDILGQARPRLYGELPASMGEFEGLCPFNPVYTSVMKMKEKIIRPLSKC